MQKCLKGDLPNLPVLYETSRCRLIDLFMATFQTSRTCDGGCFGDGDIRWMGLLAGMSIFRFCSYGFAIVRFGVVSQRFPQTCWEAFEAVLFVLLLIVFAGSHSESRLLSVFFSTSRGSGPTGS